MSKLIIRGDKLYIDYYVGQKRYKKSTGLLNTAKNRKTVKTVIIPQLDMKILTGEIYKQKPKTFAYYAEIYLVDKSKTLRAFERREKYYQRVIKYFGKRNVDEITRLDIKKYYNTLQMKAKSKGTYRTCIKEVLDLALDDQVIKYNPAINISLGKDEKNIIQYFSKKDVNSLLENAKGIIRPYLFIAFNTGLRPEEILGLKASDIQDKIISITKVRTNGEVAEPKTKCSYRKIRIPDFVNNEINILKDKVDTDFLFGDISDSGRLRHQWVRVLKDSNLEHKKLSCTRHTYATHMLKDGVVSINELSGLLGHSSAKVTLTHYASVIDSIGIDLGSNFNLFNSGK